MRPAPPRPPPRPRAAAPAAAKLLTGVVGPGPAGPARYPSLSQENQPNLGINSERHSKRSSQASRATSVLIWRTSVLIWLPFKFLQLTGVACGPHRGEGSPVQAAAPAGRRGGEDGGGGPGGVEITGKGERGRKETEAGVEATQGWRGRTGS